MLVNDCVGRPRPWVQIAKAAIASNYIRNALFDRTVLAVPVSISSDAIDCAPGGIAISSAGRSSEPCCRHSSSQTNYQLRKGFCHDDASSVSRVFFEPTPQRKNKSRTTPFKSKGQGNYACAPTSCGTVPGAASAFFGSSAAATASSTRSSQMNSTSLRAISGMSS